MPGKYTTNFIDENGNDLGSVTVGFIEKDYLLEVYPQLVDQQKAPNLWSWGLNNVGQLGDNTRTSQSSPVQTVAGGANWKQVTSGYSTGMALKTDGTLWCWGRAGFGELGDNTTAAKSSPVQTVAGGTNWKQAESSSFTTALKTDGTLWSWGRNDYGQLGDNTVAHKSSPVQTVAGGTSWKQVTNGFHCAAALKDDGTLWTWGQNYFGQLGDNTIAHKSSPVQTVAGGTTWKQITAKCASSMIAIKTDGTLWSWGRNSYGQLGDNTTAAKSSPVQTVAGGTTWKQVSSGNTHSLALKTDGTLWLWGNNANGQLGDNTITPRSSPVQTIAGGTIWRQVSGGNNHTAALKTDGTLWTWGINTNGELGDNTTAAKSSPVQTVAGGTSWTEVDAGIYNTIALREGVGW